MKYQFLLMLSLCMAIGASAQKKLLLGGSGWNKIVLLDKAGKQPLWEHKLEPGTECNSVAYTKKGQILFAYRGGARLVDQKHQTVWDYKAAEGEELHTASVLPDGGFLLAIAGKPARIVELDKNGKVRKEMKYDTQIASTHGQFRQVRKSIRGTYLLPLMSKRKVVELDAAGNEIKSYPAEGNVFGVCELKNGNLLVSGGDGHCFVLADRESGEIVKKTAQDDIPGVALQYVAEIAPWKDNLYICNWSGHSRVKDEASVIELDANGQIVWSLRDPEYKNVSAICPVK